MNGHGNGPRIPINDRLYYGVAADALPEGFPGNANNYRFRHSFASNLIRGGGGNWRKFSGSFDGRPGIAYICSRRLAFVCLG